MLIPSNVQLPLSGIICCIPAFVNSFSRELFDGIFRDSDSSKDSVSEKGKLIFINIQKSPSTEGGWGCVKNHPPEESLLRFFLLIITLLCLK